MVFHRSLNEVFRSWTRVAVLRALCDTATGSTGNQVARAAGMHPRSAFKALTALEALGIVKRQRGGRDHLFTLNRDHVLLTEGILPLLETERQILERLEAELRKILKRKAITAVLFGSVARREEKPGSDVDLCCLVETERGKDAVQTALYAIVPGLYERYGAKIAPVFFTTAEFQKKARTLVVKSILAEGKVIIGRLPRIRGHG